MRPSTRARGRARMGNRKGEIPGDIRSGTRTLALRSREVGKRRTGAGRDGDSGRAARLTSAINIPRRAADQPRISVQGKAATPERSRTAPARVRIRKGHGPEGFGDRSRSAQWGLVETPAPIFFVRRFRRFRKSRRISASGQYPLPIGYRERSETIQISSLEIAAGADCFATALLAMTRNETG